MRDWIDLITKGSALCEKAIPETRYGYWITDKGDFLPVPFESHDKVAKDQGITYGHALQDHGWIRIVVEKSQLNIEYHGGVIGRATISSLQRLMNSNNYTLFKVDVRGRFDLHASYMDAAQVMRLVHATSKKAVERYNNDDWKWATSGGYFTKNLTEDMNEWPDTIEGWDLADQARGWHHEPNDLDEGDLYQRISAFGTYHLKAIPLKGLHLNMYTIHDDMVDDYAGRDPKTAPPIIYDAGSNDIIDGNHRANAAAKRGDETILAYVGDPTTYTAPEDEDEWVPDDY